MSQQPTSGETALLTKVAIVCLPLALLLLSHHTARVRNNVAKTESTIQCREPISQKQRQEQDVFEVFVAPSDRFKFNAAHFIAYRGFRERLHGHNYSVSITLIGRGGRLGPDGYLLDFGDVKEIVGGLCKELNERFLLPMLSDAMDIHLSAETCHLKCQDGSEFFLPRNDVAELPIVHSSAEELARYLWGRIVTAFGVALLDERGVCAIQVAVAEMPNQQATFRRFLHDDAEIHPSAAAPRQGCCPQCS